MATIRRRKIRNIAKAAPVGAEQVRMIIHKENHLLTVKLDFDTVVKRVADGGIGGLYYGAPPGTVG